MIDYKELDIVDTVSSMIDAGNTLFSVDYVKALLEEVIFLREEVQKIEDREFEKAFYD